MSWSPDHTVVDTGVQRGTGVCIDGIDSRVGNDTVGDSDVKAVATQSLLLHASSSSDDEVRRLPPALAYAA